MMLVLQLESSGAEGGAVLPIPITALAAQFSYPLLQPLFCT